MTKNQTTSNQTKQLILETIKKHKPQTIKELVRLIQQTQNLPEKQITNLLIELENENVLHFKKPTKTPTTPKAYLFSSNAMWYWTTIALAIATTIAVFTIPEDVYPIVYARSILGAIFVLWLPGYTFIKALFPVHVPTKTSTESLDPIERIALSLGMSIALVPIIGLLLNYTPWGIRLTPIVLSLLALTIVFATAAIIRENQAKTSETSTRHLKQSSL